MNLIGRGYVPRFQGARSKFKNTVTSINIDLLETGDYPGDGKPKEISFPNPEECSFEVIGPTGVRVNYLQLSSIIELKLASYQSLPNSRERDKLDVIEFSDEDCSLWGRFCQQIAPFCQGHLYIECYQRARQD